MSSVKEGVSLHNDIVYSFYITTFFGSTALINLAILQEMRLSGKSMEQFMP
jgi:hypothetical protein